MSLIAPWQAAADETVRIAAVFAKTGTAKVSNGPSLQGVNIAVTEINKQGGLLGKKIELTEIDNRSTPPGSKVAAKKAVKQGVIAIIGANWSSHSIEIAKVAQASQIPMISNSSTNPKVTRTGNYIFRVCFSDPFQGRAMAKFAREDLKAGTAAILRNVSSDYSMGLAQEFRKHFEAMQGKILLESNYIRKAKSFKKILEQVGAASPEVLFIPGQDESEVIARQAQDMGITAIPLGGDGWGSTKFHKIGGKLLNRGYYSKHWSDETTRKNAREFLERYKDVKIYGGLVLAYDAVYVLADAIRRAGSAEPEKIRDALAQTRDFKGITGDITLDENGDAIKDVVIMQITQGKPKYLKIVKP